MLEELFKTLTKNVENPLLQFAIWVATLVLTVVVGIVVTKIIVSLLRRVLLKSKLPNTAVPFVVSIARIFCYVLLGISVATSLRIVEASSIVTALGAVGLAVSLAIKDSLANLMGGVLLILSKSFKLGDYVELEGVGGTVNEIGLIHTILTTPDNKRISIPNGQVTNAKIINYSAEDTRRVDFYITIDHHSNVDKAQEVLMSVVASHPLALNDPAPSVRTESFTELGVRLFCRVWANRADYWDLYYDLMESSKAKLDEAGIVLPVRAIGDIKPG